MRPTASTDLAGEVARTRTRIARGQVQATRAPETPTGRVTLGERLSRRAARVVLPPAFSDTDKPAGVTSLGTVDFVRQLTRD